MAEIGLDSLLSLEGIAPFKHLERHVSQREALGDWDP